MRLDTVQCDVCKASAPDMGGDSLDGWRVIGFGFRKMQRDGGFGISKIADLSDPDMIHLRDACPRCAARIRAAVEQAMSNCTPDPGLQIRTIEEIEREAYDQAYRTLGGNISQVANRLGVERSTAQRRLRGYGLTVKPSQE